MNREERSYDEKRDFHRMAVDCRLSWEIIGTGVRGEGVCRNLSAGGVLFETAGALAPGQGIRVRIEPESGITGALEAIAQVARCDEHDGHYRVAAAILEICR